MTGYFCVQFEKAPAVFKGGGRVVAEGFRPRDREALCLAKAAGVLWMRRAGLNCQVLLARQPKAS